MKKDHELMLTNGVISVKMNVKMIW